VVRGSLNVLIVVAAIELLGMGNAGVGYLTAALGVGGIAGGMVAMSLVARRRLALPFAAGLVLWGVPIALLAAWRTPVAALLLLVIPGLGNAILDVSGYTILQRITPDRMLGRALGVLEMVVMAGVGIGSMVGAALVEAFGIRSAMVVTGALLPILALLARRRLRAIDDESVVPECELDVLRGVTIFHGLPPITLEHLASSLVPINVPAGQRVFRKGDAGDRFYVVRSGRARVAATRKTAAVLGPGEYFGEIALLRDVPRTATVTAKEPLELYALQRDEFLAAVSRYHESAACADEAVQSRLNTL
jgi:MFS family permease